MIKIQLDKFDETFKQICDSKEKCIMLFTSESDSEGKYWCPDCEKIAPLYKNFIQQTSKVGLKMYVFIAGDRPTWKNPQHKFRKNLLLKIKGVPTLGYFNGKRLVSSLVEDEIMDAKQRSLIYEQASS